MAAELTNSEKTADTSVLANHHQQQQQREENKQAAPRELATDSDLNTQGASGSAATSKRGAAHEFTRGQEADSVKENRDKQSKLVRQVSSGNRDSALGGGQKNLGNPADRQQQQQRQSSVQLESRNQQRPSQPKQIVESTILPDRSSKLSWCCCCPCSR